ncbi:MAG: pyridoxal phosphate-dependent aminotransferase [Desulfobacteraceae bacterium]|nr:MAG: pyridoxal phosphate-dependent aminotransferase [Desulfobacteraceae bacterium]
MTISKNVESFITRSSWIRKMFEEGTRLKSLHGAENVFDFSLGNPNLSPPESFDRVLRELVNGGGPGIHGYMPNAGYPDVCRSVAQYLSREQQIEISGKEIIMTCGAAGGLNITLKAILDLGDEVITPAPYFVEYGFYAGNHGGVLKPVPTLADFTLDLDALSDAINERTKAVLINFPNNPTGQVYTEETLRRLGEVLKGGGDRFGRTIYLISDEPYRKIVYDGYVPPSVFSCYDESIVVTSYSKDISIAGERIGFAAVSPKATYKDLLLSGMTLANRILGFVSAPALMQRVVGAIQGACVDVSEYARKRDLFCNGLFDCGYRFVKPLGAFYLFPEAPIKDDVRFVQALQEERILVVPGSGFGGPGHFRIAYCVADKTIIDALPGFRRVMKKYR